VAAASLAFTHFSLLPITSLLTLSRVIVALGTPNQSHINFRDSKLTRILQPSLSGNARMAEICCATPSELYLEETRSTLLFASGARLVKTRAQVNEVSDDQSLIKRELAAARHDGGGASQDHIKELEQKAAVADAAAHETEDKLRRLKASILNSDGLFGPSASTPMDAIDDYMSIKPHNKRRLSDGVLGLDGSTPVKVAMATFSPKTMPRATKRSKMEIQAPLSPSAVLALLHEAFSRLKSEFIAANRANDILRSQLEELSSSKNVLREEAATVSTTHQVDLFVSEAHGDDHDSEDGQGGDASPLATLSPALQHNVYSPVMRVVYRF